jgi:hypothetical protein
MSGPPAAALTPFDPARTTLHRYPRRIDSRGRESALATAACHTPDHEP